MRANTVSSQYVRTILTGAVNRGYHAEEILTTLRIPTQVLTNPKFRISTLAFADLSHGITQLLRDESLGILAKPTPLGSFHYVSKACLSSHTLGDSMETWRMGCNLVDNAISAYSRTNQTMRYIAFEYDPNPNIKNTYIAESMLSTFHRFHCWLANDFLPIERVDLRSAKDEFSDEHRFVFYDAPVHYKQAQNAIYLSEQTLSRPCQRGKDDLTELLRQPITHLMTQPRKSTSIAIQVRLWMENLFRQGNGFPQLEEASVFFDMTEQTLRRRLKTDGYSFKQLKEDTRRDMAIYYIKESNHSIEEIGFRLGFSEASTFIRAFKTWTGLTPLAYRKL